MKTRLFFLMLACAGVILTACNDDDDDEKYWEMALVEEEFYSMYPVAKNVHWEREGTYYVAEFIHYERKKEVWFTKDAVWHHTKTEQIQTDVSEYVLKVLAKSEYASYKIDDIYYYESPAVKYYFFELEWGNKDIHITIDLYGNLKVV